MPAIDLTLNGEGEWPDLPDKEVIHLKGTIRICTLDRGMQSGKPSVAIRLDLPDGRVVIAETSVALFQAAAAAMTGRYGDQT